MSFTNTAAHQAVFALLRRGFGDNDTAQLLGWMTPKNQARLVEGIVSTIELSAAEAKAAQKTLEEQVTLMSSHGRNLEDPLYVAREKIATLEDVGYPIHFSSEVNQAGCCQIRRSGGRAEDWAFFKCLTDRHCFLSFTDFETELKEMFLPPNSGFRYRSQYLACKQGKRSLQEFIHDLRFLAANINDDESPRSPYVSGAQPARAYPDTFEEPVRSALSESFSSSFAHASAASSDMDVSMLTQASDDRTCFNCGRPGHFSRACPTSPCGVSCAYIARFPVPRHISTRIVLRAVHVTASIANVMTPHVRLSVPPQARVRRETVAPSRREAIY
ncbi:hypothetical protein H257_07204 [Aphanomyces astaci]|uniref:CCHC-type domain-containing protein n=1 Tax=Aphanomyces astaci TaxID=112090 RepID=W4GKY5_APHAT|nr:hypothetical protein H257_07204 [Aphanomyces astaci]ETV80016.1 hypothetical protein H257_07204 [Aphanomyces astaci]|eukprot:XP_009830952.1 hypothetical protein H257_07204 [Aphanomyces astaci]